MAKTSNPSDRVYRIQRPDGSFRGSGHAGGKEQGNRKAKTWEKPAHVKTHLKLAASYKDDPSEIVRLADAVGNVVIEYELVERRRIPVEEFLSDGE